MAQDRVSAPGNGVDSNSVVLSASVVLNRMAEVIASGSAVVVKSSVVSAESCCCEMSTVNDNGSLRTDQHN